MINNIPLLIKHLQEWIIAQVEYAGAKELVFEYNNDINSKVIAAIGKLTNITITAVCFYKGQYYKTISVPYVILDIQKDYYTILDKINNCLDPILHFVENKKLESSLHYNILKSIANYQDALIIGTEGKSDKYKKINADICPLSDLYNSEILQLFKHLFPDQEVIITESKCIGPLLPEGLDLTYDEMEWGDKQNMKNNILNDITDPAKNKDFVFYTLRQKEVIAKMHQLEQTYLRFQSLNNMKCVLRNKENLIG